MSKPPKKEHTSKIYCEKCDSIFESRKKFEQHLSKHSSGINCESCPIDIVMDKLMNLFKKGK